MSGPVPYWTDGQVTLYVGDCRKLLPELGIKADCVIADPPYQSTSLEWDRWPDGWPEVASGISRSLWCFGTLRLFMGHAGEFEDAGWKLSHDVIWEKANGTGFATDRFKGVHETLAHFYRGDWRTVRHEVPRIDYHGPDMHNRKANRLGRDHLGVIGSTRYEDDGTRMARSVQFFPSVRGGLHRTEKPVPLARLLASYACPRGGLAVDMFTGSGAVLEAVRDCGAQAVGFEADEAMAERAARRLSQAVLDFSEGDPAA